MAKYKWNERVRQDCGSICLVTVPDAQVVGDTIDRIAARNDGRVTGKLLVDESRPKKSPTHGMFEWDDSAAAEKYRIEQAKYAIRAVQVVFESGEGKERSTRAFNSVSDPVSPNRRVYVSAQQSVTDSEMRIQVMQDCLNCLVSWRKRWHELSEFAKCFAVVDRAIEKMQAELESQVQ